MGVHLTVVDEGSLKKVFSNIIRMIHDLNNKVGKQVQNRIGLHFYVFYSSHVMHVYTSNVTLTNQRTVSSSYTHDIFNSFYFIENYLERIFFRVKEIYARFSNI